MTARIEAELGKPVTLVITGGLARYVEPLCNHPHSYDPDLLPKGLALLYERQVHNRSSYNQFKKKDLSDRTGLFLCFLISKFPKHLGNNRWLPLFHFVQLASE